MPAVSWSKLHKQQTEQMLRIADETEDYVYDVIVPAMFDMDDPDERLGFYQGLDMEALKVNNPKLWERYSKDALSLQDSANQQAMAALDELRSEQEKQWASFSRQVQPQQTLGMAASTSAGMGLEAPMGRFG